VSRAGDVVLTVDGLTKRFGSSAAVDGLSFQVRAGRVTGFLGPNGAGKTTTLRVVLDLARPTSGAVEVFGKRYRDLPRPGRLVGAVLEPRFHPGRKACDALRVVAAAIGAPADRVDKTLAEVGLFAAADKRVGRFSLGMRQRLGIASAVLGEPQLLILDEPANGLDPAGIHWLREYIRAFADKGGAVFVSSHILSELQQMVDEVVVIDHGRLVVQAPIDELSARTGQLVQVRSPEADRLGDLLQRHDARVTKTGPNDLAIAAMSVEDVGAVAASAGIVLHHLAESADSLEQMYFELTDSKGRIT
jgi:ABC-2 type transport system ATP-binding protein